MRGQRPVAHGRTRYQWFHVYGFVHPASGRNLERLLPAANTDWMGLALEEFARWADPPGERLLVLMVAKRLAVPANVVLHRRLPCTPQLQPAEPLWPLVREVVANVGFDDLAALQEPVVRRCRWLIDDPGGRPRGGRLPVGRRSEWLVIQAIRYQSFPASVCLPLEGT